MESVRELRATELEQLRPCLQELAAYHNKVSLYFKGVYPRITDEERLKKFNTELKDNMALIGVVMYSREIAGFCKLSFAGTDGNLDILIVREKYRNRGLGKKLMEWAIASFKERNVKLLQVKVVTGNPAVKLYEKYGFQLSSSILWRNL